MTTLATAESLSKRFNGVMALSNFSCTVRKNEIIGLLGPNGAGKTTLLNVLTGLLAPDTGTANFKGQALIGRSVHNIANLGIARTFQDLRLILHISVQENILLCFKNQPGEKLFNVIFRPILCERHEASNRESTYKLLDMAGLSDKANELAGDLSYGQQKLLSLMCCLAANAELLLLDEPVAGIAPGMAERVLAIISDLPKQGKSAIVIEHDIDSLKCIAHSMIFMEHVSALM